MSRSVSSVHPARSRRDGWPPRARAASIATPVLLTLALALALALAAAGCGSTPPGGGGSAGPAASERLDAAARAIAENRDAEARGILEPLTSAANPSGVRGEAYLGLGRIELRAGEIEPALERFGDARVLLRRHSLWATAELLYGESRIRAGHLQSGIDALENAFGYLVSADDRVRAAFLIVRTHEITGSEAPSKYRELAAAARFPEYDPVFERYAVKPVQRAPKPVPPRTTTPAKGAPPAPSGLAFVSRKQWGAAPTRGNVVPNRLWTRITIHHTADQGEMVELGHDDTSGYLRRLQDYFQDIKKYADLPYHFLIAEDGRVYEGRTLQYQGAHAGGSANEENIGIALIGNFERRAPTAGQTAALRALVSRLSGEHGIAKARIRPHCDLKETRCPGAMLEHTVRSLYGLGPESGTDDFCEHLQGADGGAEAAVEASAD